MSPTKITFPATVLAPVLTNPAVPSLQIPVNPEILNVPVDLNPAMPMLMTPVPAVLEVGQTVKLSGETSGPTTYQIVRGTGTVDADGNYHAPADLPADSDTLIQVTGSDGKIAYIQISFYKINPAVLNLLPTVTLQIDPQDTNLMLPLDPFDERDPLPDPSVKLTALPPSGGTLALPIKWEIVPDQNGKQLGTIDPDGTYHANIFAPTGHLINVKATSADGSIGIANIYIYKPMALQLGAAMMNSPVRIQPTTQVRLKAGESQQFTTTYPEPVNWTVDGPGSIDDNGTYTAPSSVPDDQPVTITATDSNFDSITGDVTVQLLADLQLGGAPPALKAGGMFQFSVLPASIPVTWAVSGDGTITPGGLYVAPPQLSADSTAIVTATATDGSGRKVQTPLTLLATLQAAPDLINLTAGATQHFSVSPLAPVTWTVVSGSGTITPDGLYTAPAPILADETVVVQATDAAGRVAQAFINLTPTNPQMLALIVPGDPTMDGKVNTADATLVLRAATGQATLTPDQAHAADVNGDGHVTVADATLILLYAVGLLTRFPAP